MRYPVTIEKDSDGSVLLSFVDIPAHTVGADEDEALLNAVDALETAIEGYIARRIEVPEPTEAGKHFVDVPAQTAAKLQLWNAMLAQGLRKADLAKRLGVHMPQVDRLFNLRHGTRIDKIEQAARVIGKHVEFRVS